MSRRFRGYLPVVVDVETAGFNARTDALLEVAAVILGFDEQGNLKPTQSLAFDVEPFPHANLEPAALEFTGINIDDPDRNAYEEEEALGQIFSLVRQAVKDNDCTRAILVGHNSHFDLNFINAAVDRNRIKRNPFHPFSSFDTASLSGLAFGQTVLAKTCKLAGIDFCNKAAHSALYDAEKTAELFCLIVNKWQQLGGLNAVQLDQDSDNK